MLVFSIHVLNRFETTLHFLLLSKISLKSASKAYIMTKISKTDTVGVIKRIANHVILTVFESISYDSSAFPFQ